MIVGLSGYARCGKDTAAAGLQAIGFKRVAFADKLRDFLYALNPLLQTEYEEVRVQDEIDKWGWNGYKEGSTYGTEIRQLLQRLGTECGREVLGENVWVDGALREYDLSSSAMSIVITDCRFPNEAQAIKDRGGIIVRINRPGVHPVNNHLSETSLDDWPFDYTIYNSQSISLLHGQIRGIAQTHLARESV